MPRSEAIEAGEGYAAWSWEVIEAAEEELKTKGREDLRWACALALYTGQRLGDCLSMLWAAIGANAIIHVKQQKTGKVLLIPVLADISVAATRCPAAALADLRVC